ncbi:choline transporter-like protein 4 isoform X2 [Hydra vulgaris]|uniref:Choline transporter-like protein n=1 Tax=Hydra vulgaris TaxID=6087 RepID=A0ABM4BD79_HYDVU
MGCCGKNEQEPIELIAENGTANPPGKYGKSKAHDPSFNGPIKNRSCTDIICCLIFVLYIVGMLIVGFLAFSWGSPTKLLYPTDSRGNLCGVGTFADRKNLFYFDLLECIPNSLSDIYSITSCKTTQICVKDCPSQNAFYLTADKSNLYCQYEVNLNTTSKSNSQLVNEGLCAKYTLQSEALAYRCIPTVVGKTLTEFLSSQSAQTSQNITSSNGKPLNEENLKWGTIAQSILLNLQNIGHKVISDIQISWYWILAAFGITMAVSLIYIFIMRWFAGLIVWLTIYLVLTITGYATYYSFMEYKRLAANDTSSITFVFTTNLTSYKNMKSTWLVIGCICAFVLLVLILLLLALRKRISIAVQLIKEGSRSLTAMTSTLFFPIVPWFLQLILFAWFVVVLIYLSTSTSAKYEQVKNSSFTGIACDAMGAAKQFIDINNTTSCSFVIYNTNDNILRLQVFHLLGWFWLMNFIIAFGQCSLAGAFASWYWAWDKNKDIPSLPLLMSVGRTLRYHTGSLAFGSLIIAIVQLIRAALEYIEYKLTGHGAQPSPVTKFLLKCLKCCFWCLEKFLKFLNKNAYIEIAVYGKNFCVSAKNAFMLLMRNILRVAVLDKVTDFLLFIGKLSITAGMGIASFYFFHKEKNMNYYFTPIVIITVGAWVVSTAFFGVYEMAINTIFLCFLEDCERHDGSPDKPYYMSKKLMKILNKKNKKAIDEK